MMMVATNEEEKVSCTAMEYWVMMTRSSDTLIIESP